MGETYLAVRTGAGGFEREVAIKVIRPEWAEEPRLRALFLREGKLAGAINHRAVVQVFDVGADAGRFFLAMEYLRGMNLRELTRAQGGHLPWSAAAWIASEAARGLAAAHELRRPDAPEGLSHGDISPSNLMACVDGAVKVLDFGLARPVGGERSSSAVGGKLTYMPPEAANGGSFDHRVDIYALGVSLYVLLTGVQPFEGGNEFETVHRIMRHQVDPPSALVSGIPSEIDAVVARAMARQPSDRFAAAASMADALDRVVGVSFGASGLARLVAESMKQGSVKPAAEANSSPPARPSATVSEPPRVRSRRSLVGAVAIALIAVVTALVLWPRSEAGPPPAKQGEPRATGQAAAAEPAASPAPSGPPLVESPVSPSPPPAEVAPVETPAAPASAADPTTARAPRRSGRSGRKSAPPDLPPPPAAPEDRPKPRSDDVQPDMPLRF